MKSRQDRYFTFIRDQLAQVDLVPATLKTHRQILYVAFIDSLSALVLPSQPQSRARFTEFVIHACAWNDATRVSAPHLQRALSLNPDPAFDRARDLVKSVVSKWSPGELVTIDRDPEAGHVGTHWPQGKQHAEPIPGAPWMHMRHVELLYAHRNALVHSFRGPGLGMEMPEDSVPYYMTVADMGEGKSRQHHWRLTYPTVFLRELAMRALDWTEDRIRKQRVDPFEVLGTGKYWLDELNQ